jgi:membrane protease YdiL (CAAX protease family)
VVGVFLGLLRVGTGSLALPMLAHGLHNGVIVWVEFSQHLAG